MKSRTARESVSVESSFIYGPLISYSSLQFLDCVFQLGRRPMRSRWPLQFLWHGPTIHAETLGPLIQFHACEGASDELLQIL
jgi:hypothetical protein